MDVTTVVLTHRLPQDRPAADENFVFVTGGIEDAVDTARKIAGDKNVGVNGGQMASQCLDAGLLDEISVDLVPVILGAGTPFFSSLGVKPVQLDGPISVLEGIGVTHLSYRLRKDA
jgi:dihydrofolate reductase